MLFHATFKPKAGTTHEDQKKSLEMWTNFELPAGYDIKMHVYAPDGRGFGLVEAETVELIYEVVAPWAGAYMDYEILPVIDVEAAVPLMEKALAVREA
jgi:hypothetical protein